MKRDFNTPWVMSAISMLDPPQTGERHLCHLLEKRTFRSLLSYDMGSPLRRKTARAGFPSESRTVPAVNITDRYMKLANKWVAAQPEYVTGSRLMLDIRKRENGARRLPLHVILKSEEGKVLAEGITPGPSDDMRKFL